MSELLRIENLSAGYGEAVVLQPAGDLYRIPCECRVYSIQV